MAGILYGWHPANACLPTLQKKEGVSKCPKHEEGLKRRALCIYSWYTGGTTDKFVTATPEYGLLHLISTSKHSYPPLDVEDCVSRDPGCSTLLGNFSLALLPQKEHNPVAACPPSSIVNFTGNFIPTAYVFTRVLQCIHERDLKSARSVHLLASELGLETDVFIGSHLIRMFAKFDCALEAKQVFYRLPSPNVHSWNAVILAHVKTGQDITALQLYHELQNSCLNPDGHIFVSGLKACISLANLEQGKLVHTQAIKNGFEFDEYVCGTLVEMYCKCGCLGSALSVFNRMPMWKAITCSLLIGGYVDNDCEDAALDIFHYMLERGVVLDEVGYICTLKACSNIGALKNGRHIHALLIENGLETHSCVANALMDVYVNCQSLKEANTLFHRLPSRDVVTWTTLMSGYAQNGFNGRAIQLFEDMERCGMNPNDITLVLVLRACCSSAALQQGRKIHARLVECGTELSEFAGSSIVDMYGKCGSPCCAATMFQRLPTTSVVSWSALISGTAENGAGARALLLFQQMRVQGVIPDKVMFVCILKACSGPHCLEDGRNIHCQVAESGLGMDNFLGDALVNMYVKCESLEDACTLSNRLPQQTLITWSVLIGGHVQQGFALEAIEIFDKMSREGVELDEVSFVCALKACTSIAALKQGRRIHANAILKGFEHDSFVSSTLIDMYSKCGSLEDALRDFKCLPNQSIIAWGALMSGFAQYGDYFSVLRYFQQMMEQGIEPDEVSYLSLLGACSQRDLLEAGSKHFKAMRDKHGIVPTLRHYNSMVDIFGHAGSLDKVEDLLESIPFPSNLVGWTSLLTSCRRHCDVTIGRRSFDRFALLDRGNATGYVLMGHIYSQAGRWEDAMEIEDLRKCANGWKKPGKAFIEIGDKVHNFSVGDKAHPASDAIYAKLRSLNVQMQEEGYQPRVDLVLNELSEDDKVDALCGHCEKLAIAFGLISTVPGTTLRVSKNLRMCADCHTTTKLISKLEMREIVVVDAYCIHQFQDGLCSCTEHL